MGGTILRLGWSDPRTGTFGAHPQLGAVLDLNDGQTFALLAPDATDALGGIEMPLSPRTLALAGNPRTQGERGVRALYQHNRRVRFSLVLGPMAVTGDLVAALRLLHGWLQAPPALPVTLEYAPPGAASPVYLDLVGAACDLPTDEAAWLRLQFAPIVVELVARPGLRGGRLSLSNLASNPGFEQGSGPGVTVYNDSLSTTSNYTISGGSPGKDIATSYADAILGDQPLRFYRLDETSGTVAYDETGSGANGTYTGGYTLAQTGALAGDSDKAATFNGSSGYVSLPTTGLPSGTSAWSMDCWVKLTAFPSAFAVVAEWGSAAIGELAQIYVSSAGVPSASMASNDTSGATALSLNTWYHLAATFSGGANGTLTLYVNGIASGTKTVASPNITLGYATIGAQQTDASSFTYYTNGTIDEVAFYATCLSATQVATHYNAGHTPPATLPTSMTLPSGALATFGDPNWGSVNALTCMVRVPSSASTTATIYLHRTDANNSLAAQISGGTTAGSGTLTLVQTVAGTVHTLGTSSGLDPNVRYTLTLSQFPITTPAAGALLVPLNAAMSATGAQSVNLQCLTFDAVTAIAGQPGFAATSGTAAITGPVTLALFGPGAWQFASTGTNVSYGLWEQTSANTYPGGPVGSYGAARIDLNAAGGPCDAKWYVYGGSGQGAPQASQAVPVRQVGDTLTFAVWTRATGLSATSSVKLSVTEYDANGNQLRQDTGWTAPSIAGNTVTSWTQLSGTYTPGTNCAVLDLALHVSEITAGASAGASIWFDNVQCWNVSATLSGQATMPYCELRFPQSPAQFVVSGIEGDLPAPTHVACGTYLANWPLGGTLTLALGRRATASWGARLAGPSYGYYAQGAGTPVTPSLDPASYGGYSLSTQVTSTGWNPRAFSDSPADLAGTYHLWARLLTRQSAANLANVQVRAVTTQQGSPWFGASNGSDLYGTYYGPYAQPFSASGVWTLADAGPVTLPPFRLGALADPTANDLVPRTQWVDSTSGGSTCETNWQLLLPVDGGLILALLNNPTNSAFAVAGQWLWSYVDGLLVNRAGAQDAPCFAYSLEASAQPNPAHAAGGPGTQGTGAINLNLGADPYLTLDPALTVTNGAGAIAQGINQLAGVVLDGAGTVLPLALEIQYTPLYLTCR